MRHVIYGFLYSLRFLNYSLRLVAVSVCATAATLLCFLLTPFFWKSPRLNFLYGHLISFPARLFMGWRVTVEGEEHLKSAAPCIIAANHQSNWDVFTYVPVLPSNTIVLGKKELGWLPFFGLIFRGSDNILIDRKHRRHAMESLIEAKKALIEKNYSIWVFPEGTRNRGKTLLLPFKRGAFHMAIQAQRPLVPIVHTPLHFYFQESKFKILHGKIHIKVLPPVPTAGLTPKDLDALVQKVRQQMLEALVAMENSRAP